MNSRRNQAIEPTAFVRHQALGFSSLFSFPRRSRTASASAFSLIELLVVVSLIAILASLLLPTLLKAKAKAQGIGCLSNLRQMTFAWVMYAPDNADRVPMNVGGQARADWESWVRGCLTLDFTTSPYDARPASDSTDVAYLLHSPLARYQAVPRIWRCPADTSTRTVNGVRLPRTRSISMNANLGTYHPSRTVAGPPWLTNWITELMVKRTADIRNPGAAQCSVFFENREDSIKDSHFLVHPGGFRDERADLHRLVSYPASYHNAAGNLTFADGHGESRRWRDARTNPPLVRDHDLPVSIEGAACPGNPDIQWIQARTFQRGD